MRTHRTSSGPFSERPYYTGEEIEQTCMEELRGLDLLPNAPSPVRIDRFVEKRFRITIEYADLPQGVLGYTTFGPKGVQAIFVARALDQEGTATAERRIRTTLAHEAGHGLFHSHLFACAEVREVLFDDLTDPTAPKVLCRDVPGASAAAGQSPWWEVQANMAIGPLLLPTALVQTALQPLLVAKGALGGRSLPPARREEASRKLATIFEVNPAVARIRLEGLYPLATEAQLNL